MAKTFTNLSTKLTSDTISPTDWTNVVTDINNLAIPPMCRVTLSSSVVIGTGSWTSIYPDVESFDTDSMHSSGAADRITFNTAGIYVVHGRGTFLENASGVRGFRLLKNGANNIAANVRIGNSGSSWTALDVWAIWAFSAADWVTLQVYQSSGGNLNFNGPEYDPGMEFSAVWVGKTS